MNVIICCFILLICLNVSFYIYSLRNKTKDNFESNLHQNVVPETAHLREARSLIVVDKLKHKESESGISSTDGVFVLGMHRSGTSMLTELLIKTGLYVGESKDLLKPATDNELGFYEMRDCCRQNDLFLRKQKTNWADPLGFDKYNWSRGLQQIMVTPVDFKFGKRCLKNLIKKRPWILKDPRLCGTFRTWLPFLDTIPAIVFTYRHPVEVAKSLKARHRGGKVPMFKHWLRLWSVYNKKAVLQSRDLCRIISSNAKVLQDPVAEVNRIVAGLRRCGVAVPRFITENSTGTVHQELQHQKIGHKCPPQDKWIPERNQTDKQGEIAAYKEAMRIYCALESGEAFSSQFIWNKK